MTIRIVYSERARRSLQEVALFIAERDPSAALRLVEDIARRLESVLGVFPEAGVRLEDGVRFLGMHRHSAVYRFDASRREVMVLDVIGPGVDWR